VRRARRGHPQLGEDESYRLEVGRSAPRCGADRGRRFARLETLLQLLQTDANGFFVPAVAIDDAPRFPWRGLMVDVCRHWQPMEVIKRTLDGMALAKLNVLHLHLTEDQGFRIESRRYPRLHGMGSDGLFFTQDEMREIIACAASAGSAWCPEFDIRATPRAGSSATRSWPLPGPYEIERHWGIFDPTLDPTNEPSTNCSTASSGDGGSLSDPYLHIGGDENNGKQWDANPRIQAFKKERNLPDNPALQAYFNTRVLAY